MKLSKILPYGSWSRHWPALLFALAVAGTCNSVAVTSARADLPKPNRKVVVVIFTASYGGGHNSSANATRELIERRAAAEGIEVEVIVKDVRNYLPGAALPESSEYDERTSLGPRSSRVFDWIYVNAPAVYDAGFQLTMKLSESATSAGDIQGLFSEQKMLEDLRTINPDVVYSTHHFSTMMQLSLREQGLLQRFNFPSAWLNTDFVSWVDVDKTEDGDPRGSLAKRLLDRIFGSDESKRGFFFWAPAWGNGVEMTFSATEEMTQRNIAAGVSSTRIVTTGLPLNKKMSQPFSIEDRAAFLDEALRVPDQAKNPQAGIWVNGRLQRPGDAEAIRLKPYVLTFFISSGKSGLGDYRAIVEGLIKEFADQPIQIIAGCGENKRNYRELTAMTNLPSGVTLAVSQFIDNDKNVKYALSADVLVGKSGSQGPMEFALAGARKRSLLDRVGAAKVILLDVLGGQEHHTAEVFRAANLAAVVPKDAQASVGRVAREMLEDDDRAEAQHLAQLEMQSGITMDPIYQFFRENVTPARLALRRDVGSMTPSYPSRETRIIGEALREHSTLQLIGEEGCSNLLSRRESTE